jgi:hypothetical protein
MITLEALTTAWNYFFFYPESSCTVAFFRLLLGFLCFMNFALYLPKAKEYLGIDGYFNIKDFYNTNFYKNKFTLFRYLPDNNETIYVFLGIMLIFSLFMSAGLFTRFSSLMVFLGLISIGHRNSSVCSAADAILRIFSLLMIFSRGGESLSLDCYLAGKNLMTDEGAPWVQRLMQIQVSIIYFYSAITKLNHGELWRKGVANYYIMHNRAHAHNIIPKAWITKPFVQIITYGALIVEFLTSTTIWIKEFKYLSIVTGLALHLCIEMCLRIQLFGYVMMALLTLFIEPWVIVYSIQYLIKISGY